MKHYTSIEQSKHLLELGLSHDSADMSWFNDTIIPTSYIIAKESMLKDCMSVSSDLEIIPCWSLGALLCILAKQALEFDDDGSVNLSSFMGYWTVNMFDCPITCSDNYNNPIDACYEMVIKVLESKRV